MADGAAGVTVGMAQPGVVLVELLAVLLVVLVVVEVVVVHVPAALAPAPPMMIANDAPTRTAGAASRRMNRRMESSLLFDSPAVAPAYPVGPRLTRRVSAGGRGCGPSG